MIQPNELRIGNWVKDAESDMNIKVAGLDPYEIFTEDIGGVQEICDCKEIVPIPLTEELITQQGWLKVGSYYCNDKMEIYETCNGWHLHIDDDKYQTAIAIIVNSVHELQNAYFVVTKKELEVKL